jgi:beta-glucuronidase
VDIVCVNRYPAWYSDSGRTDLIQLQVKNELVAWHLKFNKPVLVTEYGAGSVIGMHAVRTHDLSLYCCSVFHVVHV